MKPTPLVLVAVLLLVTACATEPLGVPAAGKIEPSVTASITEEVTTRAELLKTFGEPEMKIPTAEGMTYFWKDPDLNSLWVLFSEDWTVKEFEWSQ